jgi:hypothetical protein
MEYPSLDVDRPVLFIRSCNAPSYSQMGDLEKPPTSLTDKVTLGDGCVSTIEDLCCQVLKAGRRFKRVIVFGHCEGGLSFLPGVGLSKKLKDRFSDQNVTPECRTAFMKALPFVGSYVQICACGYANNPGKPFRDKAWRESLKRFATKLGRTVCACPSKMEFEATIGCKCFAGFEGTKPAKAICATP